MLLSEHGVFYNVTSSAVEKPLNGLDCARPDS